MKKALIVAIGKNMAIGQNGKVPWDCKQDLEFFKEKTIGNVVIMGRRTYESIGRPLPDRYNIIVSNTTSVSGDNIITVKTLWEAFKIAERYFHYRGNHVDDTAFVIGGHNMYKEALTWVEQMYITYIQEHVPHADTFFPEFDYSEFEKKTIGIICRPIENEIPYCEFTEYTRKDVK